LLAASIFIHEYSHFLTLIVLGGEGYIYKNYTVITRLPDIPLSLTIIKLMGGLGVAIFYLLFRLIEDDPEDKIILESLILYQSIYGILEMLNQTVFIATIPFLLYFVYRLYTSEDVSIFLR